MLERLPEISQPVWRPHNIRMDDQRHNSCRLLRIRVQLLELIDGPKTVWENEPMENLAANGQLAAWIHRGFWQPMDTLRDKQTLNTLWESGKAPWKRWE